MLKHLVYIAPASMEHLLHPTAGEVAVAIFVVILSLALTLTIWQRRKMMNDTPSAPSRFDTTKANQGRGFQQDTNSKSKNVSRDMMNAKQLPHCQTNGTDNQTHSVSEDEGKLQDEVLFQQPEGTHLGDCPICYLPLSCFGKNKNFYFDCCSKTICSGCWIANAAHKNTDESLTDEEPICLFCRTPMVKNSNKKMRRDRLMKRIKVGDPIAMTKMGPDLVLDTRDFKGAIEHFSKASALGNIIAHDYLGLMYFKGFGVEKDEAKSVHHLEQAAIGGHPHSRFFLSSIEQKNGRMDRAAKHCLIAAKLGHDDALKRVKEFYVSGFVSKEDFAAALRGHQAAIDAAKSDQRSKAEEIWSKVDSSSAN